jgi:hypothetical protein
LPTFLISHPAVFHCSLRNLSAIIFLSNYFSVFEYTSYKKAATNITQKAKTSKRKKAPHV